MPWCGVIRAKTLALRLMYWPRLSTLSQAALPTMVSMAHQQMFPSVPCMKFSFRPLLAQLKMVSTPLCQPTMKLTVFQLMPTKAI